MVGTIGEILGIGFWVGEIVEMLCKPQFRVKLGFRVGKIGKIWETGVKHGGKWEKYWRPWFRVVEIGKILGIEF